MLQFVFLVFFGLVVAVHVVCVACVVGAFCVVCVSCLRVRL